jgi:hypothetical protein
MAVVLVVAGVIAVTVIVVGNLLDSDVVITQRVVPMMGHSPTAHQEDQRNEEADPGQDGDDLT